MHGMQSRAGSKRRSSSSSERGEAGDFRAVQDLADRVLAESAKYLASTDPLVSHRADKGAVDFPDEA